MRRIIMTMALVMLTGCGVAAPSYDAGDIQRHLARYGIKADEIHRVWQDSAGHTLFVPISARQIAIIGRDRERPILVELSSHRAPYCWIDSSGKVHDLPAAAFKWDDPETRTLVDEQSGYFLQKRKGDSILYVGHMAREGWLFSLRVSSDGWNINGSGSTIFLQSGDVHEFAPDLDDPAHYVEIDQFHIDGTIKLIDPANKILYCDGGYTYDQLSFLLGGMPFLYDRDRHQKIGTVRAPLIAFMDGDWLARRLADR